MDGPILVIDRDAGGPVGVQLVEGLRGGILGGRLRAGDTVPSTRALASELGVSRSAVVAAYEQLAGEGYLEMRQGAPTRVAELNEPRGATGQYTSNGRNWRDGAGGDRQHRPLDGAAEEQTPPRIDLLPGRPSTARIDTRAWRAAWRHAASLEIPSESPPLFGVERLRSEIADHLRQARGIACTADDVVVTAGTSEALALAASALALLTGREAVVAVEHPGYPAARRTLERRGVRTVPTPVDADGLIVEALRRMPRPPDAVMVTPSHQYPLGGRLPVAARLELLDWARTADAIVLEDDYDSEYRHLGPPLPAFASLDDPASGHGRVVLVGSFSKVLTPWLRLGYLVLPANPRLREAMALIRTDERCPVPGVAQDAAAALLASGAVRRHIAVTRRDYAHRRRLVVDALDGIPSAPLSGLDGGLHAVVRLPSHEASAALVDRLAADGIAVAPLADYSAVPGEEEPGIVLGYAGTSDTLLAEGLARIRTAILDPATLTG
ncbi:MocR-like pyridoxine biosynthesis transcription factor PdxR [Agromyces ramosus]|uniref:GntR family transcriptional regulator/MocR family aminotransferase n=1 Tax=Agromyces ramosus TaxID=33879 RepID=A0ABU0R7Y0_9MICO|nr:PLP-dependent aminotransferase family protein [Agromyces ramosus]MDQ0894183.1 GntR family transcriptional regulator/MocR family aminotransferase [Agromyces ramosus]